ncbi:hypothetical protein B0T22DRAFT_482227 [Podospora appendiculata]|uniref:Conidiation-specific protein 6 n=1 Tax=Podospora appendiculata TaxID=314037 RepID=A0AAE0X5B6_9PEZI|nr:hypothetical protein B0T22DRAFT_482227 [Podospora appendiculata]
MVDRSARERGLKAAINNPRVSEQAKERDRELLRSEFGAEQPEMEAEEPVEMAQPASRASKAKSKLASESGTIHPSSKTSKAAASSASEMAEPVSTGRTRRSSGMSASKPSTSSIAGAASDDLGRKDRGNVIRGLKSAINNPHVSENAKEKDRKKLRDLGESPE